MAAWESWQESKAILKKEAAGLAKRQGAGSGTAFPLIRIFRTIYLIAV
ncbi:conserved hypothetical protein [Neisseria gonorrhoeae]|nr:conserved hypothetical protein [Neisseria gonorrhoeae]SCW14638.1 conserved hypothetical protein [Neisseria gonorrhoeae]SCW16281.1 conserved hypothetical protein [Neisseria gonorrhoeae]